MKSNPGPSLANHEHHIQHLLAKVKEMERRLDASDTEIKRLCGIVERGESE